MLVVNGSPCNLQDNRIDALIWMKSIYFQAFIGPMQRQGGYDQHHDAHPSIHHGTNFTVLSTLQTLDRSQTHTHTHSHMHSYSHTRAKKC